MEWKSNEQLFKQDAEGQRVSIKLKRRVVVINGGCHPLWVDKKTVLLSVGVEFDEDGWGFALIISISGMVESVHFIVTIILPNAIIDMIEPTCNYFVQI